MAALTMFNQQQFQTICTSPSYQANITYPPYDAPVVAGIRQTVNSASIQFRVQYIKTAGNLSLDAVAVINFSNAESQMYPFKSSKIFFTDNTGATIPNNIIDIFKKILLSENTTTCRLNFGIPTPDLNVVF